MKKFNIRKKIQNIDEDKIMNIIFIGFIAWVCFLPLFVLFFVLKMEIVFTVLLAVWIGVVFPLLMILLLIWAFIN